MLPAQARLRSSEDFRTTVRGGVRAGRGTVVVHARHDAVEAHASSVTAQLPPRVGFVVSKAVGNAVTRNRVKRQLRHLMRAELAAFPPGTAVVVRALPAAATATDVPGDLHSAVAGARRKLGA